MYYNCIVFTDFQHKNYILFNISASGLFNTIQYNILKIFLKFRTFQPRYSYKIYFYKKKSVFSFAPAETNFII